MISGQGSHASSSTPQGRSLVDSLGGAAAPKFLKNWLTFAHSPYDPDHKSASGGPSAGLRGDNIQCPHFPPVARKHGNHFKSIKTQRTIRTNIHYYRVSRNNLAFVHHSGVDDKIYFASR